MSHKDTYTTFGTSDPGVVLPLAARIARSTEPHIREFVSAEKDTGRIFKYDTKHRVLVIIVRDDTSPTGNRIETAYPEDPGGIFAGKLMSGKWK